MKITTILFSLFLALTVVSNADLADGLILHYPFDVDEGATVTDQSGHGNDGAVSGATFVTDAERGGVMQFDGNDVIDIGDFSDVEGQLELSWGCWVWPEDGYLQGIMGKTASNDEVFQLNVDTRDVENTAATAIPELRSEARWLIIREPVQLNTWQHMMCVYDGIELKLYLNGVLIGQTTNGYASAPLRANSRNAAIGDVCVGRGWFFRGKLDDVRVYSKALTADEVLEIYNAPSEGELILHYAFDEDEGATVIDQSGHGNDGVVNGATWSSEGTYCFSGSDYIDIPLDQNRLRELTYSIWIKANDSQPGPYYSTIISADANTFGRGLTLNLPSKEIIYWVDDGVDSTGAFAINDVWHHVVLVYRPGDNRAYFDGELVFEDLTHLNEPPYNDSSNILLGLRNTFMDRGFNGCLDEFKVYDKALSVEVVQALYEAGRNAEPDPVATLWLQTLGFSNTPQGPWDVTEFMTDETLYVRLEDVDIDTESSLLRTRVHISQPQRPVTSSRRKSQTSPREKSRTIDRESQSPAIFELEPQEDGSLLGSMNLSVLNEGYTYVTVSAMDSSGHYVYQRRSVIYLTAAAGGSSSPTRTSSTPSTRTVTKTSSTATLDLRTRR